jgi:hypothetical protein
MMIESREETEGNENLKREKNNGGGGMGRLRGFLQKWRGG